MPDWELLGVGAALLVVVVALGALLNSTSDQPEGPSEVSEDKPNTEPPAVASIGEEPAAVESADDKPAKLTDDHVEEALKAGALAIDALLKRFPDDGRAHLAGARLASEEKNWGQAVAAAAKALELEPALADDKHLAALLWRTAQVASTRQDTFELLKGPMRARGADIIYDLATTKGVRNDIAASAAKWLDTKGFARNSTPEASVAAALFRAPSCKVRQALVKRAENVGDQRSIVLLEQFAKGEGCASGESKPCNACLDGSKAVTAAVAVIGQRHPASASTDR